jgi:hypothetical protein
MGMIKKESKSFQLKSMMIIFTFTELCIMNLYLRTNCEPTFLLEFFEQEWKNPMKLILEKVFSVMTMLLLTLLHLWINFCLKMAQRLCFTLHTPQL